MKIAHLLARVSRISLDGENLVSGINENEPKWTKMNPVNQNEPI